MSGVRESLVESRDAMRSVFRNPGLRRLNLALGGSVIGDWAYGTAASVYAYNQGGATAVGVLGVVRFVLVSVVLPFSATLADRFDRKRVMITTDVLRILLILTSAAVIWADGPALVVYALAIVTSLVGTAFRPAQAALMPRLANDPGELTASNVAASTIESVGFFVGPAIAGLLLAWADIPSVYVFDVLTFVWSIVLVAAIDVPEPAAGERTDDASSGGASSDAVAASSGEASDEPGGGMFAGVGDGYRHIWRDRDLRLVIGLYCAQTVVAGASLVFGVAIALDLLEMSESGVGLLDAVTGVGGVIGGFVALVLAQRGRLALDFGIGVAFWAAPLLLITVSPTLGASIAAMVFIGVANSVVDVNASTILQRLVPDAVMGRVFGAMDSAVIAGMALGSLLMPLLIETIGLRWGLAVIGGVVTVLALLGLAGLRRIDRSALAPEGLDVLRAVPILAPLPPAVLERLARRSTVVTARAGEVVIREGEHGDRFYVIESGSVDVTIRGGFVRSLGPGDSFGEIALLRDIARTATITVTSDLTARTIERDEFLRDVTGHGDAHEQAEAVVGRLMAII